MTTIRFLVEWTFRSSALVLGGAILLRALRVKDSSVRLAAWTAMLCGSLAMPLLTAALPYARESASVVDGMAKRPLAWGTVTMAAALIAARSGRAWIATAVVVAVTAAFGFYCRRRIGGITGDTLGANLELSESAALLALIWAGYSQ